jgi:hypothetical protein
MIRRRVGWAIALTTTERSPAFDLNLRSTDCLMVIFGIYAKLFFLRQEIRTG